MTGSKKENGTFTSEQEQRFWAAAKEWEQRTGIRVQLARIFGSRWSYVCGSLPEGEELQVVRRLRLNEDWGLLIYATERQPTDTKLLQREFAELMKG